MLNCTHTHTHTHTRTHTTHSPGSLQCFYFGRYSCWCEDKQCPPLNCGGHMLAVGVSVWLQTGGAVEELQICSFKPKGMYTLFHCSVLYRTTRTSMQSCYEEKYFCVLLLLDKIMCNPQHQTPDLLFVFLSVNTTCKIYHVLYNPGWCVCEWMMSI